MNHNESHKQEQPLDTINGITSDASEDVQNMGVFGIIRELADLPSETLVSEEKLASLFHRHPISIKRAVARGELPPPTKLLGKNVWTAKVILRHIQLRLEKAARERDQLTARIAKRIP